MYSMMDTIGTGFGFSFLWGLHILSVVAFFTGVLFFIVLAVKTFTPLQLKHWAIWFVVGGSIVCLLTIAALGRPWMSSGFFGSGMSGMQMRQMDRMMQMMQAHDEEDPDEDHEGIENMMQMMRGSLPVQYE